MTSRLLVASQNNFSLISIHLLLNLVKVIIIGIMIRKITNSKLIVDLFRSMYDISKK